ncbi:MAG: hypothetical protein HY717_01650 [Planctomycetes bacterium]|nr:hypothetical protein [Planctomycetota bacterium]
MAKRILPAADEVNPEDLIPIAERLQRHLHVQITKGGTFDTALEFSKTAREFHSLAKKLIQLREIGTNKLAILSAAVNAIELAMDKDPLEISSRGFKPVVSTGGATELEGGKEARESLQDILSKLPTNLTSCQQDQKAAAAEGQEKAEAEPKIRRCWKKAMHQYLYAIKENPACTTYRDAYEWIGGHDDKDQLLCFATWETYVRKRLKAAGLSKNSPRQGRTGRSVVGSEDL